MISLQTTRLFLDFGMLVLIWLVQLSFYPRLQYYPRADLKREHHKYTRAITPVVLPLMTAQLIVTLWQLYLNTAIYEWVSLLLLTLLWGLTFMVFVPLHRKIGSRYVEDHLLEKLVNYNWMRTFLWSLLFLYSLFQYLSLTNF
ncbi:hypothetical protein [Poritiphilus flavus]|uniref:Uncharacterized protein n=1 Tax=Poritiphilus flavus TaxID=2697053 RepID=A0A6L9EBW7_9FLAO|nr:hypothetical protein [Poritiphilus flavus]NAS12132.1 hypothetical protein [Poritiphilus flavus]